MSLALLLFQAALRPPSLPARRKSFPLLTLIYLPGFASSCLLIVSLIRNRPVRSAATVATAPGDLQRKWRSVWARTTTNRALPGVALAFAIAVIFIFRISRLLGALCRDRTQKFSGGGSKISQPGGFRNRLSRLGYDSKAARLLS